MFRKIYEKTSPVESYFYQGCKGIHSKYFPVNFAKIFRTAILYNSGEIHL